MSNSNGPTDCQSGVDLDKWFIRIANTAHDQYQNETEEEF